MINRVRSQAKRLLLPVLLYGLRVRSSIEARIGERSYSQEGEDRVLSSLLFRLNGGRHAPEGFYVDVGAHHPCRFSNTFLFYRRGWSGLNVDAMPGSMAAFARARPRDLSIEVGVGRSSGSMKFFVFNEPAVNTFDPQLAAARNTGAWRIERVVDVKVEPLSSILAERVASSQTIDFLTVDVEGLDLDVLRSNDWHRFRPLVVVVETYGKSLTELRSDPIVTFMEACRYTLFSKTVNTAFFVESDALATQILESST